MATISTLPAAQSGPNRNAAIRTASIGMKRIGSLDCEKVRLVTIATKANTAMASGAAANPVRKRSRCGARPAIKMRGVTTRTPSGSVDRRDSQKPVDATGATLVMIVALSTVARVASIAKQINAQGAANAIQHLPRVPSSQAANADSLMFAMVNPIESSTTFLYSRSAAELASPAAATFRPPRSRGTTSQTANRYCSLATTKPDPPARGRATTGHASTENPSAAPGRR